MHVRRLTLSLLLAPALVTASFPQSSHVNPWAPTELNNLPPVASLTDGTWLKGDLHVHSSHSKESSNNSVAKIIADASETPALSMHHTHRGEAKIFSLCSHGL